jgi:fermentation-respiration switch protein FrsA (DUF1100 family)
MRGGTRRDEKPYRVGGAVMSMRRFIPWIVALAMLGVALSTTIGIVSAENALHVPRALLTAEDVAGARAVANRNHAAVTDVAISAGDGEVLRGWNFIPRNGNGAAAILLHGVGDNRAGMLGNADILMRHGYAVLLPDARGHGASEGTVLTYGVTEGDDLDRWYKWLHANQSPRCIYALGESMGAAIALDGAAREPGFCAIVAESPFSSFRDAAYIRLGQAFNTGPWLGRTLLRPAVEVGLIYARFRYGVDLAASSPVKAVTHTQVPILLIHGLADDNLPPVNSERIKAADSGAQLWEPSGAGHCGAFSAAPAEYERRVVGWFESHDRLGDAVSAH